MQELPIASLIKIFAQAFLSENIVGLGIGVELFRFVDSVGARGTGIALVPAGGNTTGTYEFETDTMASALFNSLSVGRHTLYVRALDAAGNWGATVSVFFKKNASSLRAAQRQSR